MHGIEIPQNASSVLKVDVLFCCVIKAHSIHAKLPQLKHYKQWIPLDTTSMASNTSNINGSMLHYVGPLNVLKSIHGWLSKPGNKYIATEHIAYRGSL